MDYQGGKKEERKQGNHCLGIKEFGRYPGTGSANLGDARKQNSIPSTMNVLTSSGTVV